MCLFTFPEIQSASINVIRPTYMYVRSIDAINAIATRVVHLPDRRHHTTPNALTLHAFPQIVPQIDYALHTPNFCRNCCDIVPSNLNLALLCVVAHTFICSQQLSVGWAMKRTRAMYRHAMTAAIDVSVVCIRAHTIHASCV